MKGQTGFIRDDSTDANFVYLFGKCSFDQVAGLPCIVVAVFSNQFPIYLVGYLPFFSIDFCSLFAGSNGRIAG